GECGTYTYDIAQTEVMQVKNAARQSGFPLRCRIEEA
ncbi:MAG TPA: ATP-dependent Clp protease adaptor ClpS, partial [Spirochaetota bacterium]|nr:ATP-dependent Clp protease adaptor ClpS [Spirochaetota bacterium]